MKTLRIAVATMVVAACGLLAAMTPASAATYGSVSLHISDNHTCCGTGDVTVQITSDPSGVVCESLTVSASNGALVYKGGSRAPSQTFTNVKTPFTVKIFVNPDDDAWSATTHATCSYDDTQVPQALGLLDDAPGTSGLGAGVAQSVALVAATQVVEASGVLDKTACPNNSDGSDSDSDSDGSDSDSDSDSGSDSDSDSDGHGGLPNTGGERLLWLIIGLLLLVGGTTVVLQARREDGAER